MVPCEAIIIWMFDASVPKYQMPCWLTCFSGNDILEQIASRAIQCRYKKVCLCSKPETIVSLTIERDILVKLSGTDIEECSVCALSPCISSSPTGLWAPSCCWPWLPVCLSCSRLTDSSASKLPLNLVMFSPSARRLKIAASWGGDLQMWLSWMLRTWSRGFSYKVIVVGTGSHISQCSVKPNISWKNAGFTETYQLKLAILPHFGRKWRLPVRTSHQQGHTHLAWGWINSLSCDG